MRIRKVLAMLALLALCMTAAWVVIQEGSGADSPSARRTEATSTTRTVLATNRDEPSAPPPAQRREVPGTPSPPETPSFQPLEDHLLRSSGQPVAGAPDDVVLQEGVFVRGRVVWEDHSPCVGARLRAESIRGPRPFSSVSAGGPDQPIVTGEDGSFVMGFLPAHQVLAMAIDHRDLSDIDPIPFETQEARSPDLATPIELVVDRTASLVVEFHGFEPDALRGGFVRIASEQGGEIERRELPPLHCRFDRLSRGRTYQVLLSPDGSEPPLVASEVTLDKPETLFVLGPQDIAEDSEPREDRIEPWSFDIGLVDTAGTPLTGSHLYTVGIGLSELRLHYGTPSGSITKEELIQFFAGDQIFWQGPQVSLAPPIWVELTFRSRTQRIEEVAPSQEVRFVLDLAALERETVAVRFRGQDEGAGEVLIKHVLLRSPLGSPVFQATAPRYRSPNPGPSEAVDPLFDQPVGRVPPGRYVWDASADGYPHATGTVDVLHGIEQTVVVTFAKAGVLDGRVEPVPEGCLARVEAYPQGEARIFPRTGLGGAAIDTEGGFKIMGLRPGDNLLSLLMMNLDAGQLTIVRDRVTIRAGAVTHYVLHWREPPAPVRFRLGHPELEAVLLWVRDAKGELVYDGPWMATGALDLPGGTYAFEGYPPLVTESSSGFDQDRGFLGNLSEPDEAGVRTITFDFPER